MSSLLAWVLRQTCLEPRPFKPAKGLQGFHPDLLQKVVDDIWWQKYTTRVYESPFKLGLETGKSSDPMDKILNACIHKIRSRGYEQCKSVSISLFF